MIISIDISLIQLCLSKPTKAAKDTVASFPLTFNLIQKPPEELMNMCVAFQVPRLQPDILYVLWQHLAVPLPTSPGFPQTPDT